MTVSILVVDDEPDVADSFRQHFRREARQGAYALHFALSASERLNAAGGIEPQLIVILSDINMPGIDGLALLREIKTRRPDLPVMMFIPPMAMTKPRPVAPPRWRRRIPQSRSTSIF